MDARQIADAIISTWQEIEAALSPIIGTRGVAALYARSLKMTQTTHPWLPKLSEGVPSTMDVERLRTVLAQQDADRAAAGGRAHLHRFYELLASLVGSPLTGRLLHSVWDNSSSGPPPQELSHDRQ